MVEVRAVPATDNLSLEIGDCQDIYFRGDIHHPHDPHPSESLLTGHINEYMTSRDSTENRTSRFAFLAVSTSG